MRQGWKGLLVLMLGFLLPMRSAAFAAWEPSPVPAPKQGAKGQPPGLISAAKRVDPAAKIPGNVDKAFKSASKVTYFVKMHATADVVGAAKAASSAAAPAVKDLQVRTAVINALRATAEGSQRGVIAFLEAERAKGKVSRVQPYSIVNLVAVTSTRDVMQRLAERSDVAKIVANEPIHLVGKPAASRAKPGIASTGPQNVEWNIQRVGAPSVWSQFGITGTGAVIASLDTGVDWTHPALQAQWRGNDGTSTDPTYSWYDVVNDEAMPYDDHGHGTHTTGTMAGREPDGSNEIGVAPGARWIAAKILSAAGTGSAENIIQAGEWMLAPGGDPAMAPDVVNNSWGGGPGIDDWFRDVVAAWRAAGIVPVFAAGNDGPGTGSVSNPGNYPESFAVGATDSNDALATFSGRGPSPYGVTKPEIAAPGVNVRSAVPGGGYDGGWSGTSMAAPHVAGTVALLRSADASLTIDEIEAILKSSADPKTNSSYPDVPNNGFGHGILNAHTAVGMVVSGAGSVSGRVVTAGDDLELPTLTHTPVAESFKRTTIEVIADIADNIAVTSVQLRFRAPGMSWWGVVDMVRTAGDHRSGTYSGTIPADMTQGATVHYYIQAMDYGANSAYSGTASAPHRVTLLDGITPGYRMDFESAATGWTHGGSNDPWQIGTPTSGPGSAHEGSNVAATNLSGNYPDNSASYLLAPPMDLSGGPAALRFWHWHSLEDNWDYGYVIASGDGGATWQALASYTGESDGWREAVVDLTAYAGNPSVYLAFYLASDGSVNKAGWYLDDIELYQDTEPPGAPTGLRAEPTAAGGIALVWDEVAAPDLAHYTVYRSTTASSGYTPLASTTNGSYVDSGVTAGTTYYYVVSALDQFGNESGMSDEASASPANVSVVFADDMESGAGTWTAESAWQLGAPTSGPNAANSGSNLWATNLAGNYGNNANASLTSPTVDLAGLGSVTLQFAHWYSFEPNYDYGIVEVSADGGSSWTEVARYTGNLNAWEQPSIDLSAFAGHPVKFRFRLRSDSSVTYPGWYIDDVRLAGTPQSGMDINLSYSVKGEDVKSSGKAKAATSTPGIKLNAKQTTVKQAGAIGIQSLPVSGATVTVLETGRVVRADPATGGYSVTLPTGGYILRAEAYGYYPQEQSATVHDGADTPASFVLQAIPRGYIEGEVTDGRTGAPLAEVQVSLAEDLRVAPVTTDANGRYRIEALIGSYTLQTRLSGYYPGTASVTVSENSTATVNLSLRPFIGMPGEIAYDDGTAENAWGFLAAGNGWAVRMSPQRAGQSTVINGASIYLWDASWPVPGGNTFQAAIYSANPDGTPGALLAGPVRVDNAVRGGWNDVDFSQFGVTVQGDFYIVYIQDRDNPNMPGMAVDESSPDSKRNWQMVSGAWSPWDQGGNFMIRAVVSYEIGSPVILSPRDGDHVNQSPVTVTGTASAGTRVDLYRDGAAAGSTTADEQGGWSLAVDFAEGPNVLTATATVPGGGTTDPSTPVTVTLDTQAPAVTITAPADGSSQKTRVITVTGSVAEEYPLSITVNGQIAQVGSDGSFIIELIGQEGANLISTVATDWAGNTGTAERTVYVDTGGPTLSNMEPATDRTVGRGDQLLVAFESEPGLALAAYQIVVSMTNSTKSTNGVRSLEPGESALTEVTPGRYEAVWTVPGGLSANEAWVRFRAVDASGNETRATAPGKLTIRSTASPVAVISAATTGRAGQSLTFDGRRSYAPDGQIVAWRWEMGNGATKSGKTVKYTYTNAGTYTVTLTVTDSNGATGTATHTITISPRR